MPKITKYEMPPITELDDFTESINLLVYADPGAGKTVFGGTGPVGRSYIVGTEPGTISAKRMGSQSKQMRVKQWGEFAEWLNWARKGNVKAGEWWTIDTLTELQPMCLQGIIRKSHETVKERVNLDVPQLQDYNEWYLLFKKVVKAMNDLPCNMLYLCHSMDSEDEDGDRIVLPYLSGKLGTNDPTAMAKWVCGTMHAYGYLKVMQDKESGEEFRRVVFKRSGAYFGKDRYGVLAPYINNPTLVDIERRITKPLNTNAKDDNAED